MSFRVRDVCCEVFCLQGDFSARWPQMRTARKKGSRAGREPSNEGHTEASGFCFQSERLLCGRDPNRVEGGTGEAEAAKLPGAGLARSSGPGKCAAEKEYKHPPNWLPRQAHMCPSPSGSGRKRIGWSTPCCLMFCAKWALALLSAVDRRLLNQL
jgi:hypothetical protein